ncbi:MAG TPA: dihydroorotate dehydrogenase [Spirochaetia bacterium]|nr:dihydroorotate dehydrogenase [Spirochaetia bacterium]
MDLSVSMAGVKFSNPVITASGTSGYGYEFDNYFDINQLGGVTLKGLTLEKRPGNTPPRICETACGLLNSIGLANEGYEFFIGNIYPRLEKYTTNFIANISGSTVDDYVLLTEKLSELPKIKIIEINASCPNVKEGGMAFGSDIKILTGLVKACSGKKQKPLFVKLSPNTGVITDFARACEQNGADGLTLVNTLLGMKINIETGRPALGNIMGGYSGAAVMPVALRMVWQTAQVVKIPIIGSGGILSGSDALEFIMAGAACVAVGTASLYDPMAAIKILDGIRHFCCEKNRDISSIKGCAL